MDKRILTLGGIILAVAAVIFFIKFSQRKECPEIGITMDKTSNVRVGDVLQFHGDAEDATDWHWTFTDGSEDQFENPVFIHLSKAGKFTAKLIVNNACEKTEAF